MFLAPCFMRPSCHDAPGGRVRGSPEEEVLAESYQGGSPAIGSSPHLPISCSMPKAVALDQLAPMGIQAALQPERPLSIQEDAASLKARRIARGKWTKDLL